MLFCGLRSSVCICYFVLRPGECGYAMFLSFVPHSLTHVTDGYICQCIFPQSFLFPSSIRLLFLLFAFPDTSPPLECVVYWSVGAINFRVGYKLIRSYTCASCVANFLVFTFYRYNLLIYSFIITP